MDIEHSLKIVQRDVFDRQVLANAGVVHQDVHSAQLTLCLGDQRSHRGSIGNAGGRYQHSPPELPDGRIVNPTLRHADWSTVARLDLPGPRPAAGMVRDRRGTTNASGAGVWRASASGGRAFGDRWHAPTPRRARRAVDGRGYQAIRVWHFLPVLYVWAVVLSWC